MTDLSTVFVKNGAAFAIDLFHQLGAKQNYKENFVFSPFSIQCCMALAFAGSSGETLKELVKGLRLVSEVPDEVADAFHAVLAHYNESNLLKIGNKVYINEEHKLNADYEKIIKERYLAAAENINFTQSEQAAKTINDWVSERTAGKIKNLISSDALGPLTGLVLLNAIHFKGQWEIKFPEEATAEGVFWTAENKSVKVQFMNKKAKFPFTYNDNLKCSILEMRYKDSDLSMLVLLPDEREGLQELASQLKTMNLLELTKNMYKEEIIVKFPKFKIEHMVELKETLQKLGINKVFTSGAELNDMLVSAAELYASQVVHKAIIEVNEEGTEAAAATGMVMMMRCLMTPLEFVADHPFLYFIWDRKNILFGGAFVDAPNT